MLFREHIFPIVCGFGEKVWSKTVVTNVFPSWNRCGLKNLNEKTFLDVFEGVPQAEISSTELNNGLDIIGALAEKTGFLKSNGEARRALKENSISVNKEKVGEDFQITSSDLINGQFVLLQRGKKNYFIIKVV